MLESKKIDLATQVYNKFQSEYYYLRTNFCDEKILDLQIDIMLLQYKQKLLTRP
jgi:hypothetical protein